MVENIYLISEVLYYSFKTERVDGIIQYRFGKEKQSVQKQETEKTYENPMNVPLLNQMSRP